LVDRKESGTKTVYLVDSSGTADLVQVNRKRRDGTDEQVQKPSSALIYNRFMDGIDRHDGALWPYSPRRKMRRWTHKLAFQLMAAKNSWIVHSTAGGAKKFREFLESVVRHLLEDTGRGRKRPAPVGGAERRQRAEDEARAQHLPRRIPPTEKVARPTKRCRVCNSQTGRKTIFQCATCPGEPGLYVGKCFAAWHA
jgi:hypothetical protein